VIVSAKVDLIPSWSDIVILRMRVCPPLEVVNESVMVLEGRRLKLEVTEVVDVPVVVLGGRGMGMGVTGGTIGNVVFRAGHPKDPTSRRTGQ